MKRIVPGIALASCWLFLLLSGSFSAFWLVVVIIALIGAHEYLKMALPSDTGNPELLMLSTSLALPVILSGLWHEAGLCGGLFFSVFLSICYILTNYTRLADSFGVLSRLVFGAVYVGFFAAHLVLLWLVPEGNYWLIILVAITAGSDSGAYYSGRTWGRHKLCRNVSPNKTIEGAIGGVISGLVIAVIFAVFLLDNINWVVLVPMAILLTGVGIAGDLSESIIKRGTDTKDSGKILLGHGGILDRIDSLLLSAPVLYYLLIFTG
ncbi:phosphatidate cytidylyltransferase [Desulfopila inferna]|uniref:phosphatidate cytidylyltransferase n=1 Tax=Desulfopila inferna TaxID=468528 RepID=UPI001964A625|nr:phosphatidate cytidylyltransferase [Desulfopila inferna]MBM9605400.1 phosphatidate cytidylyltransferase [Desulfopila inferna]